MCIIPLFYFKNVLCEYKVHDVIVKKKNQIIVSRMYNLKVFHNVQLNSDLSLNSGHCSGN